MGTVMGSETRKLDEVYIVEDLGVRVQGEAFDIKWQETEKGLGAAVGCDLNCVRKVSLHENRGTQGKQLNSESQVSG